MKFNDARIIVGGNPSVRSLYPDDDFMVAEYGWQDGQRFLVVAGTRRDVSGEGQGPVTFDGPIIFVDKQSGAIELLYGLQVIGDPTAGMTPVGA